MTNVHKAIGRCSIQKIRADNEAAKASGVDFGMAVSSINLTRVIGNLNSRFQHGN